MNRHSLSRKACLFSLSLLLSCAGSAPKPPRQLNDLCAIFQQRPAWYQAAQRSKKRWGAPIQISMAIMWQESKFRHDARNGAVYGYPQAKKSTWRWYQQATGNPQARRDRFADAIDFIAWYMQQSRQRLGISLWNAKHQYLAYHEGHGGYARRSYRHKPALLKVADKVAHQAKEYGWQLKNCKL